VHRGYLEQEKQPYLTFLLPETPSALFQAMYLLMVAAATSPSSVKRAMLNSKISIWKQQQ
jgi:hypothetical protein